MDILQRRPIGAGSAINGGAQGYQKIKVKLGVEGGTKLRRDIERIRKVREAIGPEIDLLVDADNCWDAATAMQVANNIREYDIYLFEEPVFADDITGLAIFKRGTDIPLGTGEHEYTKFGVRNLVINNAVDIVQVAVARVGGYTEIIKAGRYYPSMESKICPARYGAYA